MKFLSRVALTTTSLFTALVFGLPANASPVAITVNGVINTATGTLASELGNTYTATYLIDFDRSVATYVDLDSSNNPQEDFTTSQEFYSGAYYWSASSNSGSIATNYVAYDTFNDFTHPGINTGQPFDALSIWGSDATGVCPQAVLDVKGSCDNTDMVPGDGFELGLDLGMTTDWFDGTDTPSSIPSLNSFLFAGGWGAESSNGVVVGEFSATVTSMMVTPVPEPEAWGLMLSGLMLVGAAARRRNQAKI